MNRPSLRALIAISLAAITLLTRRRWLQYTAYGAGVGGALLAISILSMFALGLAMQGRLYANAHDILEMLGLAGDLGSGLLYFVGRALGLGTESVQLTTADYGTRFIVVAGLLNVIAAVDAHNLRTGRKA